MTDVLLKEQDGSVLRLTMNRPDKLNAMNADLVFALIDAVRDGDASDSVAVMIIAGAGRAFSAGADISKNPDAPKPGPRDIQSASNRTLTLYKALLDTDTPLVAEVHGYALGGGCNVAVSCDLVVASENAVFGYPELKVGLAATAVAPPLVHQIGRKAAFELLTLCENIPADRALKLGMINRVVGGGGAAARPPAQDTLRDTSMEIAKRLAAFDNDALWMTKQTIRRSADLPLASALEMARDMGLSMKIFEAG